ncbi:MAG TPA: DUF3891 family protein [Planctomycetota bacterium]|nr:DUF3891 family protein [Planctomycetota bacterium]
MLKTRMGDEIWLVTQPDHAAVSGYLAMRWGNEAFARPGHYAPCPDPESLRNEVLFAIREHDNGWWEWEADPRIDTDGLPLHLTDLAQRSSDDAMERWRFGVPRFARSHPYASLLISWHAYWLYAPRAQEDADPAYAHPIFGSPRAQASRWDPQAEEARRFIAELEDLRRPLEASLASDPVRAAWLAPESLDPHVRLLQVLDSMSLALSSEVVAAREGEAIGIARYPVRIERVARRGKDDRVDLDLVPSGERRIICEPFPFDEDPLRVDVLVRRVPISATLESRGPGWWHAYPKEPVRFEIATA